MLPRFPLYIPSKSRVDIACTPAFLDEINVPYRLVVEASQADDYAARFGRDRILVLDPQYQRDYDMCGDFPPEASRGPGPARNFIWDHAISEGHAWHWIMDDNIQYFIRLHLNQRIPFADGTGFHAMESFALRYTNVAMAGPHYEFFAPSRQKRAPFITNTRVYSCNLIRNDVPFRWRGRYNEDTILSLDMLKAGWSTVVFFAFLAKKMPTQELRGGNTEAFYASEGTGPKSEMLYREHPDVTRLVWRYGRQHHFIDYQKHFGHIPLIRRPDYDRLVAEQDYPMKLIQRKASRLYRNESSDP